MMIVLDANLLVTLVSGDSRRIIVLKQLAAWLTNGEELHAPWLAQYEVANGLTRLLAAGMLPFTKVPAAWNEITLLPITYHALASGSRVIEIARALRRQSAYDAAYLALAEMLGAELWTLDGPLYRNVSGLSFPIHLLT